MSEAVSRANVATATVYKVNRIYLFTGIVVRSVGGNFLSLQIDLVEGIFYLLFQQP